MTPSDRERLCTCLTFPPNHAPDCPRSSGERLREAGWQPSETFWVHREQWGQHTEQQALAKLNRSTWQTHNENEGRGEFAESERNKAGNAQPAPDQQAGRISKTPPLSNERPSELSTGQTEEETSAGTRCIHGVWLADHCYQCNGPNPAPLTSQSVSAPEPISAGLWVRQWLADDCIPVWDGDDDNVLHCLVPYLIEKFDEYAREYASSSNAALQKEIDDADKDITTWRNTYQLVSQELISERSKRMEAEAERDSLREALREQRKNAIEIIRLRASAGAGASTSTWNISPEWVVAECDAALGDPPEKGTV